MSYKVVVTTCRDADMLVQARLTNQALGYLTRNTLRVVAPEAYEAISEAQLLHWTTLLIDEAAQATEPEALIPLMVVAPPLEAQTEKKGLSPLPQLLMAGDECQLGPRLCSGKPSALSTSLFARLFSRSLYAQHPLSRQRGSQILIASMLPMNRPAFANLFRNYRSHPSILSVPSQLFYNDTLIPESNILSDIIRTWPGWKSPCCWPVLFVQNTTPDAVESVLSGNGTGAGALTNHGEVLNALQLVQGLLQHRVPNYEVSEQIREAEIAVMSPFRTQVNLIRKIFREKGLYDVNIGPLEAFQGLESRIVVLCTTRTRRDAEAEKAARFVREDRERGLGVIGEPKRLNVAITRAKEGLIVLGDPKTLTVEGDPSWEAFISFCARNGCVMREKNGNTSDTSWADELTKKEGCREGRLERALVFAADVRTRETTRKEHKGFGYPESPETRRQNRVSLKGQMPTSDEAMWKTGSQMAEDMDEPTLLEDEDVDQRADNEQDETSPSFTAVGTGTEVSGDNRVFSSASARDFDLDPKAEFERTDCSTQ
jgi:helicase MOV-10